MLLKRFSFLILLLGILVTSCGIETARPFKKQHLFIASDCLAFRDTILFRSFEKNQKIEVHIRHFSADSLKTILKVQGYNTEFDAVIFSSVFDMNELHAEGTLQKLTDESLPESLPIKYRSRSRTFCGIGIDPYVIVTKDDSTSRVRSYKDLIHETKWCSDLDGSSDWFPFYAVITNKIDPKAKFNAVDWISNFLDNKERQRDEADSIAGCKTVFTTYSNYRSKKIYREKQYKDHQVIFPNQRSGGTYYNMPCFAIVKQARNYTNAISFLKYIMVESVNKRLNFRLSMFPLIKQTDSSIPYQNIRFKKYSISPVRLTANYERLKNILKIIK